MIPQIDFKSAIEYLKRHDEDLAKIIALEGQCRLTIKKQSPYMALLQAIAGQQLHAKAAQAILKRLRLLNQDCLPTPEQLLNFDKDELRLCGFSYRKIESLHSLALATIKGHVPTYQQALALSDQSLIDQLVVLPGIGRWTIEMFLIFTLGRMDIMPVDDFGIREGWRICKNLSLQPKPKLLKELTMEWSPYRSIGAWYLWRAVERLKPQNKQNPLTK